MPLTGGVPFGKMSSSITFSSANTKDMSHGFPSLLCSSHSSHSSFLHFTLLFSFLLLFFLHFLAPSALHSSLLFSLSTTMPLPLPPISNHYFSITYPLRGLQSRPSNSTDPPLCRSTQHCHDRVRHSAAPRPCPTRQTNQVR